MPYHIDIIQKLAPEFGATVLVEPNWNIVAQVTFPNGNKRYFKYSTLDINTYGASSIVRDKDFAHFFMQDMGYSVPKSITVFSKEWAQTIREPYNPEAAVQFAHTHGYPVVVKPNNESQGRGITFAYSDDEVRNALSEIFEKHQVALVQEKVPGKDYRIVVLDGEIEMAYERVPLNVIGNGVDSISTLLTNKQETHAKPSSDARLDIHHPNIRQCLARHDLTMDSVVAEWQQVFLRDNANLTTGGDAVDVTNIMHPYFQDLCLRLAKDMNLRLCGVDLMIHGSIDATPDAYWILELNASPGLDHFVRSGSVAAKKVEAMFRKIFTILAEE